MIVLETERLFLREWVPDDWVRLKRLVVEPRVIQYINQGGPWPDDKIESRVREYIHYGQTRGWHLWPMIHRADAKLIGFCGFSDGFLPDVEIGWRLLPEYWGQGLATEAAKATLAYGFKTWNFPRVIAVAKTPNRASIRVMEKIGMIFDGTFDDRDAEVVRYVARKPRRDVPAVADSLTRHLSPRNSGAESVAKGFPDEVGRQTGIGATDTIIRRATARDAAAIADIYNEAILTTTATFDTETKTIEERIGWMRSHDDRHPVLVAVVGGLVVGWASLASWSDRRGAADAAETSFYVHSSHRGRGIGRKLKQEIIREARRLGYRTLIARVAEGSYESLHLIRSEGFVLVGTLKHIGRKFGKMLDVHILQKMLDDTANCPRRETS